jgi:hypothetical protein
MGYRCDGFQRERNEMPDATIVAKFSADANQWVAHFEKAPQVAFGEALPVPAIRRLLEGTEAEPDAYTLRCDDDLAGNGILLRSVVWDPPELLFPCATCSGCGVYVGLQEREPCGTCNGRGCVPS